MPIDLNQFMRKPGKVDLSQFERKSAGPGDSPENPIDIQHSELQDQDRTDLYYYSPTTDALAQNLRNKGFEAQPKPDGNVAIRKPGGKWHVFDESGFSWKDVSTDLLGDVQDLTVGSMAAVPAAAKGAALGTVVTPGVGTAVGGFGGGVLGFGAGYGASRGARGVAGAAMGYNREKPMEILKGAGEGVLEGAAMEAGGKLISPLVKAYGSGLAEAGRDVISLGKKVLPDFGVKKAAGVAAEGVGQQFTRPSEWARKTTGEAGLDPVNSEIKNLQSQMEAQYQRPWRAEGEKKQAWEATGKEVHAPVAEAKLKAGEAHARAETEMAAAREAARGKVEEALARLAKEVPGVRAVLQTSVKPPVAGEAAANVGGKGLYRNFSREFSGEELDALLPHKILAKNLRVMPEWQEGFKRIWGEGFYSDLSSADMKNRPPCAFHFLQRAALRNDLYRPLQAFEETPA